MICSGCQREIEVGDRYIEDSASGFLSSLGHDSGDTSMDSLMSEIFGGSRDGKLRYCEDCTTKGGDYLFETNYGEEA